MIKKFQKSVNTLLLLGYLLGIHRGYLALWKGEDPQCISIFPVKAASLPVADQVALRRGIRADDEAQLLLLLEDYL